MDERKFEEIEKVVSDNVGVNSNLYGVIHHIDGIVGVRKVSISIYHERLVRGENNDEQQLSEVYQKEVEPVVKRIRSTLDKLGYDVTDEDNFNYLVDGSGSYCIRLRTSIGKNKPKKEEKPVAKEVQPEPEQKPIAISDADITWA